MDERAKFEAWFKSVYGECPSGNLSAIEKEIDKLTQQRDSIDYWTVNHRVALGAWHARHNQDDK